MKATEAIEHLERLVTEFGDAELVTPDQLEDRWRNPVDRMEFDSTTQSILLVSDS